MNAIEKMLLEVNANIRQINEKTEQLMIDIKQVKESYDNKTGS